MKKKIFIISLVVNFILLLVVGLPIINKLGIKLKEGETKIDDNQNFVKKFYHTRQSIYNEMPNEENEIIFLGDSLTDYCEWHELLNNKAIKNRGISTDNINGIIDRLGEVTASKPRKIFLMVGINDLLTQKSNVDFFNDYEKLLLKIKNKSPETILYVQSILPITQKKELNNTDIELINEGLIKLTNKYNLTFINLFDRFISNDNNLNQELTSDGIHLNGKGYLIWAELIKEYVNE